MAVSRGRESAPLTPNCCECSPADGMSEENGRPFTLWPFAPTRGEFPPSRSQRDGPGARGNPISPPWYSGHGRPEPRCGTRAERPQGSRAFAPTRSASRRPRVVAGDAMGAAVTSRAERRLGRAREVEARDPRGIHVAVPALEDSGVPGWSACREDRRVVLPVHRVGRDAQRVEDATATRCCSACAERPLPQGRRDLGVAVKNRTGAPGGPP